MPCKARQGPVEFFCYHTPSPAPHLDFSSSQFHHGKSPEKIPSILLKLSCSIGIITLLRHHQSIESERFMQVSEREIKNCRGMDWFSLILGALDDLLLCRLTYTES